MRKARQLLGLSVGNDKAKEKVKPTALDEYDVFIQSTSYTRYANTFLIIKVLTPCRKLIGGTKFLYEVDDWDKE